MSTMQELAEGVSEAPGRVGSLGGAARMLAPRWAVILIAAISIPLVAGA